MEDQYTYEDQEADVDFGGSSAGAQDGGIVDTGSADNDTDYSDRLAGSKGGAVDRGALSDDLGGDLMDTGDNIGSTGDMTTVGTDHGMPGTWAGGESSSNTSDIE